MLPDHFFHTGSSCLFILLSSPFADLLGRSHDSPLLTLRASNNDAEATTAAANSGDHDRDDDDEEEEHEEENEDDDEGKKKKKKKQQQLQASQSVFEVKGRTVSSEHDELVEGLKHGFAVDIELAHSLRALLTHDDGQSVAAIQERRREEKSEAGCSSMKSVATAYTDLIFRHFVAEPLSSGSGREARRAHEREVVESKKNR